jgi:hypothetical protein
LSNLYTNDEADHDGVTAPRRDGPLAPIAASIAKTSAMSGLSRSEIYRLLSAEKIRAIKSGRSTLILVESVLAHLGSLPAATFRAPKSDTR